MAEVAARDPRVTGGLFLLDPWLVVCDKAARMADSKKPMMLIKTGVYHGKPNEREAIDSYMKGRKNGLYLFYEKATHNCMTDLVMHMPRELVIFDVLKTMDDVEGYLINTTTISRLFFETVAFDKGNMKKILPTVVYERYKEELNRIGQENPMVIEDADRIRS